MKLTKILKGLDHCSYNQTGVASLILILVVLGITAFLLISATFQFKDKITQSLYGKRSSLAAGVITNPTKLASFVSNWPQDKDTGVALTPQKVASTFSYAMMTPDDSRWTQAKAQGYTGPLLEYVLGESFEGPAGLETLAGKATNCNSTQRAWVSSAINTVTRDGTDFCNLQDAIVNQTAIDHDLDSTTPAVVPTEGWFVHSSASSPNGCANCRSIATNQGDSVRKYYHMNVSILQVRQFYIARILKDMRARIGDRINSNYTFQSLPDGVFLDNINVGSGWGSLKTPVTEFSSSTAYSDAVFNFVKDIHENPSFKSLNKKLWANMIAGNDTGTEWDRYAPYLEGGAQENYILAWGAGPYDSTRQLNQMKQAESWITAGNVFIAVGWASDTNRVVEFKYSLASYLLIADGTYASHKLFSNPGSYREFWDIPEQYYNLGYPIGPKTQKSSSPLVYQREFLCGHVELNMTSKIATINLTPSCTLPANQIYWGSLISDNTYHALDNQNILNLFNSRTKKYPSIIHRGGAWYSTGGSQVNFGSVSTVGSWAYKMDQAKNNGAIPLFGWLPHQAGDTMPNTPNFQLADIYNGNYDAYITQFARDIKDYGKPFFLRLAHEMNGNWYAWGEGKDPTTQQIVNGNAPGDYVKMWRHVHDIFTSQGATNVTWVWCPNVATSTDYAPLAQVYPGDSYVDWTCIDGYNKGTTASSWKTFSQVFKATYDQITQTIAPTKPLMIGETATQDRPSGDTVSTHSKPQWITDALTQLPTNFPLIKAFVWFNWDAGDCIKNWPIQGVFDQGCPGAEDFASEQAFSNGIASNYYATNTFGNLASFTKIQPLNTSVPSPTPTPTAVPTTTPLPTQTPIPSAPPIPDLVVTSITWSPSNPTTGSQVTFSATIKNQGTGVTPNGVIHGVRFSIDNVLGPWSDNFTTSIPIGGSVVVTANNGPAPQGAFWTATNGTHTILANVDDQNRIVEGIEINNTLAKTLIVTATPSPTPTIAPIPTPTPTIHPTQTPSSNPSSTPNPTPKPGDINGDGVVNVIDYGIFVGDFGATSGVGLRSDINKDRVVNVIDYGIFVGNFGH